MHFKDSIVIDAPLDKIWQYLASPDVWSLFHAKAGKCEQISPQGGRIGSVYLMDFRMGVKTTSTRCEIIDLQLGKVIQVKSTITDPKQTPVSATITYRLEYREITATAVNEQVDISTAGINIFMRAIIWFISRFGQPQGETTLKKLKRIVEEG